MSKRIFAAAFAVVLASAAPAEAQSASTVTSADASYASHVYTVSWSVSNSGAANVYAAPSPDSASSEMKILAAANASGSLAVADPLGPGVRPYFYVLPVGAQKGFWTATRVVPLEGASNFRDLGGYATADGRHVVWGRLFRSNDLANLTDADYRMLDGMGVRVVCDLRTVAEQTHQPTHWQGPQPVFEDSKKPIVEFNTKGLFGKGPPDPVAVRNALIEYYRLMIDSYAEEYRTMFQHLLAGDVPIIVHCTAGKDRTGVGSALILTALGVPRETIIADYAMSARLLYAPNPNQAKSKGVDPTVAMFSMMPPDVAKAFLASDPVYIQAAFDQAATEYGSVDSYLEKRLGIGPKERAALQARYLQ